MSTTAQVLTLIVIVAFCIFCAVGGWFEKPTNEGNDMNEDKTGLDQHG
jgi:hypothetical protein